MFPRSVFPSDLELFPGDVVHCSSPDPELLPLEVIQGVDSIGHHRLTSSPWRVSPVEAAHLAVGGTLWLTVIGDQPAVSLEVVEDSPRGLGAEVELAVDWAARFQVEESTVEVPVTAGRRVAGAIVALLGHSRMLNTVMWTLDDMLGRIPDGAEEFEGDWEDTLDARHRVFAELDASRDVGGRLAAALRSGRASLPDDLRDAVLELDDSQSADG